MGQQQHTPEERKKEEEEQVGRRGDGWTDRQTAVHLLCVCVQEYLCQLELIRQQYQQDMRERRLNAAAEVATPAHTLAPNDIISQSSTCLDLCCVSGAAATHAQNLRGGETQRARHRGAAERLTCTGEHCRPLQRQLSSHPGTADMKRQADRRSRPGGELHPVVVSLQKGIMFEIHLAGGEVNQEEEQVGHGGTERTSPVSVCPCPPTQEVNLLNQTVSFLGEEKLKLRDWSERRKGWSQRTPQTLLDALARMEVNSVYSTAVEAEAGAAPSCHHAAVKITLSDCCPLPPSGEEVVGRRRWAEQLQEAELDILTPGELEVSTVTAGQTLPLSQGALQEEEPDEERAEPRSDDEDT